MQKLKFKNIPKKIKSKFLIIGVTMSILIGLVFDEFDFYFDEIFFIPFLVSLFLYFLITFLIGFQVYEGYKILPTWIKRLVFGGGFLISVFLSLLTVKLPTHYFFREAYYDRVLTVFSLIYISIFVFTYIAMWIYYSYKKQ